MSEAPGHRAHLSPWRIHDLTGDFWLEDVWALPKQGGPDDFSRLVGRNDAEGDETVWTRLGARRRSAAGGGGVYEQPSWRLHRGLPVNFPNTARTSRPWPPPGEDARVRCDVDGPVATIILTRPDRGNAQTPVTWAALRSIRSDLPGDVRVVVVRAEGASFSAGLDRAMFTPEGLPGVPTIFDVAHAPAAEAERIIEGFQEAFSWLGRPDILSVAAVQGHAIGAGFQLALACDLRVAAEDAEFTMAETSLGLVPDLGGTRILRELVGYSRAVEICATGRPVAAAEAARIGLVNLVVPRDDLDQAVHDLVAALLAPPRAAAVETKALLLGAAMRGPAEQLLAERQAQLRRIHDIAGGGE